MSYATDPMGAALDRHITGNFGEDQFAYECPDAEGCAEEHADDATWECPWDGDRERCLLEQAIANAELLEDN